MKNPIFLLALGVALGYVLANKNQITLPGSTTNADPLIGKASIKNHNVIIDL